MAGEPYWYKDAVIYEVPVKAFFDGNGDGIGDFPGLIGKLDYLQELGVNTLWLLPFYPSPGRDDGYDIADYHRIHPALGTLRDFRVFIREAHARGLRVISELVINHTSDQHPWFQAARRAPAGSAKRNYYVWSEHDRRYAGTRIIFSDTEISNWAWDEVAGAFYWHRFFSHQPDLNFAHPSVFKALMRVMRFWFDAGVDGMRLDAVPYLCEQEGTNNENLPRTHEVIRRMRAELDQRYEDRMFLAEANQWPEDVRAYFGHGDECHMAYHFPLMPRMYMAIAREDRHPIVEIMEQTPDIPDNCQWAVFLRNHDELTLEMVTDRERDYLYDVYAVDPRARLNLGIRRRLAPLLENDRPRIELLHLLLMTLTGSPILYYGDEIGMGDNLQLGDRNGVRTPMQWNNGLNGGFSNAAPDRLYLPPIVDPVYSYAAVNVEAQQRSPFSLLNWTRRLIAMRRGQRAFGRGSLRFLRPGNRKILVYLREYEGESLLCVANLARSPQAVELDLAAFSGRVPVELMGHSRFPPIGSLPYLLTLGGHGFYAFRLAADVAAPVWHEEPMVVPELPVLVLLDGGWRTLFARAEDADGMAALLTRRARDQLERQILPSYFLAQPWFADRAGVLDRISFETLAEWTEAEHIWLLARVAVRLADGALHHYALPLALAWEEGGLARLTSTATLAKVRLRAREGALFDAFWDDDFCRALVAAVARGDALDFGEGRLAFTATGPLPDIPPTEAPSIRREVSGHGRQRVYLDNHLVLKSYRWLLEGTHPELETSRHLAATGGFAHAPSLAGSVEFQSAAGEGSTLAIIEHYANHQGDAWSHSLDYLERYLESTRTGPVVPEEARHGAYLGLMKVLGLRTAQFHQALARPDPAGEFGVVPLEAADIIDWVSQTRRDMDALFTALEPALPHLPAAARAIAERLLAARPRLYRRILRAARVRLVATKTRIHGNYHLGQVWLVKDDVVISNYGGEPGLSLDERRRKYPPLRDVASLLFDLGEVAASALAQMSDDLPAPGFAAEVGGTGAAEVGAALQGRADAWLHLARATFYRHYRRAMRGHPAFPEDVLAAEVLLTLFRIEHAIHRVHACLAQGTGDFGGALRQLLLLTQR